MVYLFVLGFRVTDLARLLHVEHSYLKLLWYPAVSGKVVQRKRKAYATIPKGSMGLSEESVHVLNIHTIKKR